MTVIVERSILRLTAFLSCDPLATCILEASKHLPFLSKTAKHDVTKTPFSKNKFIKTPQSQRAICQKTSLLCHVSCQIEVSRFYFTFLRTNFPSQLACRTVTGQPLQNRLQNGRRGKAYNYWFHSWHLHGA